MRETSELYKQIISSGNYWTETRLVIGDGDDPDEGYDESVLCSMSTYSDMFSEDTPVAGCCIASEIDITMYKPDVAVPANARLVPYVRITDGVNHSEWLQKGVFRIDTRERVVDGSKLEKIRFRGYDDMLKAEQDYTDSSLDWGGQGIVKDYEVVNEIAALMGVSVDSRTTEQLKGYPVKYPWNYSCREVLGYIAAAYGGAFVMSDLGQLRLVSFWDIPKETNYLITETGATITFGGDRILV